MSQKFNTGWLNELCKNNLLPLTHWQSLIVKAELVHRGGVHGIFHVHRFLSSEAKDETMEQKEILESPNHVVLSRMLTI